jgi:hypothetical protein
MGTQVFGQHYSVLLTAAGGGLGLAGLLIAMFGVSQLLKDLIGVHATPGAIAMRWLRAKLLFGKSKAAITGVAAASVGAMMGSATLITRPHIPNLDATNEEWRSYFLKRHDSVDADLNTERAARQLQVAEVRDALMVEVAVLRSSVTSETSRVVRAVAGDQGRGLRTAWYGLLLSVVGAVLGVVGSLLAP